MLLADLLWVFGWALVVLTSVAVTFAIYRGVGALVASQGLIMSFAALVDAMLVRSGVSPLYSLLVGVTVGLLLGLSHIPILLTTGPAILLVLTVVVQIVATELWTAMPSLTGGTGGLLLPHFSVPQLAVGHTLSITSIGLGVLYYRQQATSRSAEFDWVCLRGLALKAGVFGVAATRRYAIAFALYGILLAVAGMAATRSLGFLTHAAFGLSWSLVSVLLALVGCRCGRTAAIAFACAYCVLRVVVRQSIYASVTSGHLLEIAFPTTIILFLTLMRSRRNEIC